MKILGRSREPAIAPSSTPENLDNVEAVAPTPHHTAKYAGRNATPLAIAEAEIAEQKEEPLSKEDSPEKPRLLENFDLKERIQEAYKSCEIKLSPEVMEALQGYYTDHYKLADIIGVACGDDITEEELKALLEREDGVVEKSHFDDFVKAYNYASFSAPPSAESAVRILAHLKLREIQAQTEEDRSIAKDLLLRCASASLQETLFQETSLGITTLKDDDIDIIENLFSRIVEASSDTSADLVESHRDGNSIEWPINNGKIRHRLPNYKHILQNIQNKKDRFWEDCRMAGQLELHNTGHMPLITQRGNILLPRTEQHRRYGTMHVQTAVGDQMHSVVPHFAERLDTGRGYKIAGNHHLYKTETEGRGGATILIPLADIIRVAPYARDAHYAVVEQKDPTKRLVDQPTTHHLESIGVGEPDREGSQGKDRVFFASSKLEDGPDAYEIKMGSASTILFIGDDLKGSEGYGSGDGFPQIRRAVNPEEASYEVDKAQKDTLEQPAYKGKVVVPLRRHIFNFIPENMNTAYNTAGRKAPTYNRNPLLAVS